LIGKEKVISYNYKTRKICPSDWIFTIFTASIIVFPTCICQFWIIALNENIHVWLKIVNFIIVSISLTLCLYYLFKCSYTDPGIIPSVY
jgi:hypothetical protein